MDVYLRVLNWSLDTSKADAMLARLPRPVRKAAIIFLGVILLLIVFAGFSSAPEPRRRASACWDGTAAVTLVLALLLGAVAAYGVGS